MRLLTTAIAGFFFVAWADAQQTAALTAAERLKQIQINRQLLDSLVKRSLTLSTANKPLDRAVTCRKAMDDLAAALDSAIAAQDANRVAELGDLLTTIVAEGLIPTLTDASADIPAGSPDRDRLLTLHKSSSEEFNRLERSVPRVDAFGRSDQVKKMLANWQVTRDKLTDLFNK